MKSDREWLYRRYVVDRRSCGEIGSELGISEGAVYGRLKRGGIPTRSLSEAIRIAWSKPGARDRVRGDRNPMRRPEVARKFLGDANPSKRPEVNRKKTETRRRNGTLLLNGGRTRDRDGYEFVYQPNHPYANSAGYVREHRLVMESLIGRFLLPREVIHHRNGKKDDNRPENLMLCADEHEHRRIHIHEREQA